MGSTIGDGINALALAGGIVGYLYVRHRTHQKKIEAIHLERMAAMEKGIPLPEFPMEPARDHREVDATVITILGMVLFTLSIGTMIVLYVNLPSTNHSFWISPLPFAFLGVGFIAYPFLKASASR